MKNIVVIFLFLSHLICFGQKTEIKGKVIDADKKAVEAATVYLSAQKDSTLIDYTITDTAGNFKIPLKKTVDDAFLTISYLGLEDYTIAIDKTTSSFDFGTIQLKPGSDFLDELVINTDVAPVRVKKDTLEFNAASFKVRPDATVKELLEQLPGVEVDEEGKIKVNGKEVSNVLVNGKPFFSADGKVIMENLPAEIINKVQITDYKSKEEKLSGAKSTGETQTINLTIDESKNKGLFGQAVAGYGTNDRYESSLMFNYFKGDLKLNVLGSSNNINSTGFSTDEIMDNMSGGRNRYSSWSSDGTINLNGLEFGGGQGIYQTDMLGFNYNDVWGKKNDVSSNYLFNEVESTNKSRSRVENLLPNNRFITTSTSDSRSKNTRHSYNYDIEVAIDSLTTFSISPKLQRGINTSNYISDRENINEFGELINDSKSDNFSKDDTYFFENELLISRRFKKKGRSLSINFSNKNSNKIGENFSKLETNFYQEQSENINRDQRIDNKNHVDEYNATLVYREPISDKQTLSFSFSNRWLNEFQANNSFDLNATSQQYTNFNSLLSFTDSYKGNVFKPIVSYNYGSEKIYLSTNAGTDINNYTISSIYNNAIYTNKRLDILPYFRSYLSVSLGKSTRLGLSYSYSEISPEFYQMLEYQNLSNPLSITSGNKDLQTTKSHSTYINFSNYDWQTRSGYYFYGGGSFMPRHTTRASWIDDNLVRYSSYINVEDTYNFWMGLNYSKSYNLTDKTKLTIDGELNYQGYSNKGIQNNEIYSNNSTTFGPEARFTFDFNKKLIIKPQYKYSLNSNSFKNVYLQNSNFFMHNASLMITSYWPKNTVFGSDMTYGYNSNLADGFKKDYLLWNLSVGYNFYNDRFLAKVKVYDLLNQNQSISRSVSATSISDVENTILKQYFMFSLTYKLEKFAGKKKGSNEMIIID